MHIVSTCSTGTLTFNRQFVSKCNHVNVANSVITLNLQPRLVKEISGQITQGKPFALEKVQSSVSAATNDSFILCSLSLR